MVSDHTKAVEPPPFHHHYGNLSLAYPRTPHPQHILGLSHSSLLAAISAHCPPLASNTTGGWAGVNNSLSTGSDIQATSCPCIPCILNLAAAWTGALSPAMHPLPSCAAQWQPVMVSLHFGEAVHLRSMSGTWWPPTVHPSCADFSYLSP